MKKNMMLAAVLTITGYGTAKAKDMSDNLKITPFLDFTAGIFYSHKSYDGVSESQKNWQEAYAKYGLDGVYQLNKSEIYGSLKGISSGTFGDGDASGVSNGKERRTSFEEWTIGWRNGHEKKGAIDLSIGRQNVQIADGFLVAGDALNLGKGIPESNRGGAYYLAARRSFSFTTVLNYQLTDHLKTHWYYLNSDNKAQNKPSLWATDWEYAFKNANIGATFLQINHVDDPFKDNIRDDLKDYAVRAKIQVNEKLKLSGEYVYQKQKNEHANAWYVTMDYIFLDTPFQPQLGYRYSTFSKDYDALFYGNTDAGFGTWFQGEVAGNYAGPFSKNARIQQISLQASVKENLNIGLLGYQFNTINKNQYNLNGHEIDMFAIWSVTKNVSIIPLIGFYKPEQDLSRGGSQVMDNNVNTYMQVLLQYLY